MSVWRFGRCELDEVRRELRVDGREVPVQPLVLDLLVHMVHHRDVVLSKDELLSSLWPDAVVGDGSLQRTISLARTALREGGAADAIRTYPRKGYRWVAGVEHVDADAPAASHPSEALERVALIARLESRPADAVPPLERLVSVYRDRDEPRRSANAALALARVQTDLGELAVARGWLTHAKSLLAAHPPSHEHGMIAWVRARIAILEGNLTAGLEHTLDAWQIAEKVGDADVRSLALCYWGLILMARGETTEGARKQDEAAAAVLAGEVTREFGGIVYCGVIYGCRHVADWDRAAQWTDTFVRWCDDVGMDDLNGTCRVHRAEVLGVRGEFGEAEREAAAARDMLASAAHSAAGDAHNVLGEIHRSRGELDLAEKAFRRAHALGWDPQPGLALVQLATGRIESARRGLDRALAQDEWISGQKRGRTLAIRARVAVAEGDLDAAHTALGELEARPSLWPTRALEAEVFHARGVLHAGEDSLGEAAKCLQHAARTWTNVGCPHHAAEVRQALARVLAADGDREGAELELAAAEQLLVGIDAPRRVAEVRKARSALAGSGMVTRP